MYRKLARGEELSEEELKRLEYLESEKMKRLRKQIEELLIKGEDKLTDEEKFRLYSLQRELLTLELE
jgi:hypothetical protein